SGKPYGGLDILFVDSQVPPTLEKAGQFIESTQEADGSRYGSCRVCYTISIMVCSEKLGNIHRIRRRKSKPGANRLGIDR
ncbi:unnamed protein product, partial [Brassica oleracea]